MSYQPLETLTLKDINDAIVKLHDSIEGTDVCMLDIYTLQEKLEDRINLLEEELFAVKAENVDIREHLRCVTKELNTIAHGANEKYGFNVISETNEIDEPQR